MLTACLYNLKKTAILADSSTLFGYFASSHDLQHSLLPLMVEAFCQMNKMSLKFKTTKNEQLMANSSQ